MARVIDSDKKPEAQSVPMEVRLVSFEEIISNQLEAVLKDVRAIKEMLEAKEVRPVA